MGFHIELEFGNLEFLGRGNHNYYYLKKSFWSKVKNKQQAKPTDSESTNPTRPTMVGDDCSHLCTIPDYLIEYGAKGNTQARR